jgi:hypothetical protein
VKDFTQCVMHGAYFRGWGYMRFWEPRDDRARRSRADVATSKGHGVSDEHLFRGRISIPVMEVA